MSRRVGWTAVAGVMVPGWLGGLVTGYGNRSYHGRNVFVRLLYLF